MDSTESQGKRNIRIACPYYINLGRLVDLYASTTDGYSASEEIEITNAASGKGTRRAKLNFEKAPVTLGLDGSVEREASSASTTKKTITHTGASLLNHIINQIEIKHLDLSKKDIDERIPNMGDRSVMVACGDIIEFEGEISQDILGAEDYITFGFETKAMSTERRDNNTNTDNSKYEARKKQYARKKATTFCKWYLGIVLVASTLMVILGFIMHLFQPNVGILVIAVIVTVLAFVIYLFSLSRLRTSHASEDDGISNYGIIKKERKKGEPSRRVKIRYETNERDYIFFVGELYNEYLYQSDVTEFLGRNIRCLGVVKHLEERDFKIWAQHNSDEYENRGIRINDYCGEVEIVALYA